MHKKTPNSSAANYILSTMYISAGSGLDRMFNVHAKNEEPNSIQFNIITRYICEQHWCLLAL